MKNQLNLVNSFKSTRKFWVAVAGGLVQALELFYDVLPNWAQMLVMVLTAAGVYQVSNARKDGLKL